MDTGEDSVNPGGMRPGLDVYCGYVAGAFGYRAGSFNDYNAVKAAFPGKKYIAIGIDCIDVENGLATAQDARNFVLNAKPINTNRPVVYANASTMPLVQHYLVGVPRNHYYLWVAEWDGNPNIPAGYDGKQYASTQGYDANTFAPYMWETTPIPRPPSPSLLIDGFQLSKAGGNDIDVVISWWGDNGIVRRHTHIPRTVWNTLKWIK